MLIVTGLPLAPKVRRPSCTRCCGTGYVSLWSVTRAGQRTWYCDRCKWAWPDTHLPLAPVGVPDLALPALVSA